MFDPTDPKLISSLLAVGDKKNEEVKFKELDGKLTALKRTYPQLTQASVISEPEQQRKSYIRLRGNYKSLGVEVQPGSATHRRLDRYRMSLPALGSTVESMLA